MFGYILPEKPELKIKEYEIFRAYYCGLCKAIGKRYGQIPRITLNYDTTFLAVLLSSLSEKKPDIKRGTCLLHPAKKKNIVTDDEFVEYASDINIILSYYNLKDKWKDDTSIISGAGMLLLMSGFKRARKRHPEKCQVIKKELERLALLEKEKCSSMDEAAEPFAKLMEEVLAYEPLCIDAGNEKILRWIGYNIGKWIYILDAYHDLADDVKNKSYNPLLYQFAYQGEDINGFAEKIRHRVEFNLIHTLSQIAKGYQLLDVKHNNGLLENIVYMGMLRKTEKILGIRSCESIEESL